MCQKKGKDAFILFFFLFFANRSYEINETMMKTMMTMLALFLFSLEMAAQQPRYEKMSPLVRQAVVDQYERVRHIPSHPTQNMVNESVITAFVRIQQNAEQIIRENDCRQLAQFGSIYILSIPLNRIASLSDHAEVVRIEAGKRTTAQMDTTRIVTNAVAVNQGDLLPQGYTGQGVIVGVQDIGFDLTHPTFFSADMKRYRIRALWDQLSKDTLASSLYVGRDYVGRNALLTAKHSYDGATQTHGTHTAGIAVGSGTEGTGDVPRYRGIAYDADIVLVANATSNNAALIDAAAYYKYTYATDALGFKYIFDFAKKERKPCVINFSEGGHQDFRGDDQLYYEILDSLTGAGAILVASAGNDADFVNYIHKPIGEERVGSFVLGNPKRAYFSVKTTAPFIFRLKIYEDRQNPLVIDLKTEDILSKEKSLLLDSLKVGNTVYRWAAIGYPSSYDKNERVFDLQLLSPLCLGCEVPISLELVGANADVRLYRIQGYLVPNSLNSQLDAGNHTHSIHSPSSAPSVICVGATAYRTEFVNYLGERKQYNNGEHGRRTSFSGVGPTLDGRTKPDVMAPGQNIVSSYNSFYVNNPAASGVTASSIIRLFEHDGSTYAWASDSGTSMSAPVVTGAIALWLQAYPQLTPEDCLEIFRTTCKHYDSSLVYPNNLYGYGEIDIYAGLKEVLKKAAAGIQPNALENDKSNNVHIYRIDGRYVGTSPDGLSKGIYIRNGKKFVVY